MFERNSVSFSKPGTDIAASPLPTASADDELGMNCPNEPYAERVYVRLMAFTSPEPTSASCPVPIDCIALCTMSSSAMTCPGGMSILIAEKFVRPSEPVGVKKAVTNAVDVDRLKRRTSLMKSVAFTPAACATAAMYFSSPVALGLTANG